eukprot:EG_transcript_17763
MIHQIPKHRVGWLVGKPAGDAVVGSTTAGPLQRTNAGQERSHLTPLRAGQISYPPSHRTPLACEAELQMCFFLDGISLTTKCKPRSIVPEFQESECPDRVEVQGSLQPAKWPKNQQS